MFLILPINICCHSDAYVFLKIKRQLANGCDALCPSLPLASLLQVAPEKPDHPRGTHEMVATLNDPRRGE
ncbi:MAG TPA: hypothetical protein DDW73_04125 [Rhizobium sp.]|nr:hypothetical protein [Rhizobium sp.]